MSAADYESEIARLLFGLLIEVAARHEPAIVPTLKGEPNATALEPALLARALQAQGMWFQLLSIAEQNAAMRRRREAENTLGDHGVRGTFAQLLASVAREGVEPAQ